MDSKVSEKDMREVYFQAFGKEYDGKHRKTPPLPLEIAYIIAKNKLKKDGKYAGGGEITDDSYFQSVNHFIYFCMNYPNNFLDAFGGLKTHLSNKFKDYYNKYGVYGVMIKFYAELDSENKRILTDYSLKNYKGTPISSDISETEYFNSVNHFIFFCFNFPDNFMDAFSSHLKVHLSSKWTNAYEKKGSIGAMIYFWSELDGDNRRKLADWVKKNYTGTKLYEVGGALGDVAGMLPSPLPMSTIQPMAKGGDISADDFIKQVKSMHNNIDEVVLKDGTHIAGKDLMAKGGQLEFFADGGEIPKEYEKYLRPYYAVDNMDWEGKVILKESDIETITDWIYDEIHDLKCRFFTIKKIPNIGFVQVFYPYETLHNSLGVDDEDFTLYSNFKMDVKTLQDYILSNEIVSDIEKTVFLYPFKVSKDDYIERNKTFAKGGGVDRYDYEDIGQFSIPDSEWKNYTDEEFNKIGRKIVSEQFDGNIGLAYDKIVYKKLSDGGGDLN